MSEEVLVTLVGLLSFTTALGWMLVFLHFKDLNFLLQRNVRLHEEVVEQMESKIRLMQAWREFLEKRNV